LFGDIPELHLTIDSFQAGIYRMFRLLMLKISAFHYYPSMVVYYNFEDKIDTTTYGVSKKKAES